MRYSNPANLAIVACPGGEAFADQVIVHLKDQYRRIFDKTVDDMAKRYALDPAEVTRRISFINEVTGAGVHNGDAGLHLPRFKVPARFTVFPNGELKAEILESIRGKDIFIVQDVENRHPLPFNGGAHTQVSSVNDHLLTVYVTVDAVRQAGAGRITLVMPVYPYARQHQKKGREGLTASLVGKTIEALGVERIITLDLHSREIVNAFSKLRLENLHASYQIIRSLSRLVNLAGDGFVVAAPDTGSIERNKFYATALKKPLAMIYKERDYSRVSRDAKDSNISDMKLLGSVRDKTVFMADDMAGTGGTLLKAMRFLKEQGAGKVLCAVSLPLFTGDAVRYFEEAYRAGLFHKIIGTNAVYHEDLLKREWYESVNITKLFAQIISRLHHSQSISSILDNREVILKSLLGGQRPISN